MQNEQLLLMDPANPVIALCARGMALEGNGEAALRRFEQAWDHLAALPAGGYREFVAMGIDRLTRRLETAQDSDEAI